MMNEISSLDDYICSDNTATFYSYGNKKGKFKIPKNMLSNLCLQKKILRDYALVEVKTEYYVLSFDFDFKPLSEKNKEFFNLYDKKEDNITETIISQIEIVLQDMFVKPDTRYILCDKNSGKGIHLYYPNVIINKSINQYIISNVLEYCYVNKSFGLPKQVWNKIIDPCISKGNGLRLLYFCKDGSYYQPNYDLSSFDLPRDRVEVFKLCFMRTDRTSHSPAIRDGLKFSNNDPYEKIVNVNEKQIKKKSNSIKQINDKLEEQFVDIKKLELTIPLNIVKELLNVLSLDRIDSYFSWIDLVFICKNYNLKNELIEISKKSNKYDDKALQYINRIFKSNKPIPKFFFTERTLIRWAMFDNPKQTRWIYYKMMNKILPLTMNHSDEILLHGYEQSYDLIENSKYISQDAIDHMINKITNSYKTILIHSPTGSGKTCTILKLINAFIDLTAQRHKITFDDSKSFLNIMSIVSRRSMISTHQNSFKELHMRSYLDEHKFISKYISSIEHLNDYCPEGNSPSDILILDESDSLLKYMYSSTLDGKRLKAFNNLYYLCKTSKLIIICDANITSIDHSFIVKNPEIFGEVFRYRNTNQNKNGTKMIIYQSKCKSEDEKILQFTKLFKQDVKLEKTIIIFSDSKKITEKLEIIIKSYNIKKDYILIFNKDSGLKEELDNCNNIFDNKVVIASPKILYGLDILIQYEKIYCIYKYTSEKNAMTALEYHQQYSRCRNCKEVHILDMNPLHEELKNYLVPLEKHIEVENQMFKKYMTEQEENIKKYQVANEMMLGKLEYGDIVIDTSNSFTTVHHYKTWFDRLFSKNKIQLVHQLAKEAGYEVEFKKLDLKIDTNVDEDDQRIDMKDIKKNKEIIVEIYDYLIKEESKMKMKLKEINKLNDQTGGICTIKMNNFKIMIDIDSEFEEAKKNDEEICSKIEKIKVLANEYNIGNLQIKYPRVFSNVKEMVVNRLKLFRANLMINITEDQKREIILNDSKFTTFLHQKYLFMNKDEFEKAVFNKNIENMPQMAGTKNVMFERIKFLFELEKFLNINRFEIDKIDEKIKLEDIRKKLYSDVDKLIYFVNFDKNKKVIIDRFNSKINKITRYNKLQMFVVDLYNSFGNIIVYDIKRTKSRVIHHNFRINK